MRAIGVVATAVVVAVAVGAVVVGARSLPDVQRYLRIRRM